MGNFQISFDFVRVRRDAVRIYMLRTLAALFFLGATSYHARAQNRSDDGAKRNELNVNTVYLFGGYPELSYERIIGKRFALGISIGYRIDLKKRNYVDDLITFDYAILPYYRFYFGKKRATGFFLEGNSIVFSRTSGANEEREIGAGLGIGLGLKFRIGKNWSLGIVAGGGYNLLQEPCNNDIFCFPDMYPRLGLTIGKSF